MISAQQFVIAWIEYSVAAALLLAATKLIVDRLRQPADRINLITLSLVVSACVPLLLALTSGPSLRLGVIASNAERHASVEGVQNSSIAQPISDSRAGSSFSVAGERIVSQPAEVQPNQAVSRPSGNDAAFVIQQPIAPSLATSTNAYRFNAWSIAATLVLVGYGLATAWFLAQLVVGVVRLHTIARRATSADSSLQTVWQQVTSGRGGSVRLLVTDQVSAPMVCGTLHTTVFVPKSLTNGELEGLRYCLAHEWSHVQCHDLMKWQIANWCQLFLWYQPLVWILRRELRVCQDLIADDYAAGTSNEQLGRIEYSELLITIAKQAMARRVVGTLAFHDRSSQLTRRIKMLLTNTQSLRPSSTLAFLCMSGLLLMTFSLLIGSVRLSAATAQEVSTVKPADIQNVQPSPATNQQPAQTSEIKTVRGRVVNAAGEAVPGAKLWLQLQYEPRRVVTATSDADGKFRIDCPADWISTTTSGSLWTVWAYAHGYSIQSENVYATLHGESHESYTLTLPDGSTTGFKILNPEGEPLEGVLVKPLNYKTSVALYEFVPDELQSILSASTDASGKVLLPVTHSGALDSIEMFHASFGRQTMRVTDQKADDYSVVRLRPSAFIRGRLVGEKTEWTRNVKLYFNTQNQEPWKVPQGIAEAVTDDQGNFEVPKIATGIRLSTVVSLDPKLPVRPLLNDNTILDEGGIADLEIPLVPAPIVHGQVIEKSTGKPVANAKIMLSSQPWFQNDLAVSDDTGRYEGRVLPGPVQIQIIFMPDGLVQLGEFWTERYQVPTDATEFELPTIEVVRSEEVVGQLVDADDKPLPNQQVEAIDKNRNYGAARTDAQGQFKIHVPVGVDTEFVVSIENRGRFPVQVLKRTPLRVRFSLSRFSLERGERKEPSEPTPQAEVTLTGKVFSSGEPVAAVSVKLHREVSNSNGTTTFAQASETKTDAKGSYRLSGLSAGDKYYIEISPAFPAADPTWQHQMPYIQTVPHNATGTVDLPDVRLLKLNQSISGVVVDPNGKPVKGASIGVKLLTGEHLARMTPAGPPPWAVTDSKGRFQIKELPDAPLAVFAFFANPNGGQIRYMATQDIDKNQQNIRFVLDPALRGKE